MLQIHDLHKSFGITTVLSGVSFIINDHEHVGLVSPNGSGKSTLLRCIVGDERPDRGVIARSPESLTIGYLPQAFGALLDLCVGEALAAAQGPVRAAEAALEQAAEALGAAGDLPAALARYDAALARFEALGGYAYAQRAAEVLEGLGLGAIDQATPVAQLSGGQKTRLGLATLLVRAPDLLLLDEPTNHLDIEALEWLEGFVRGYHGAALIVSHDRAFLDRTTTRTLYLDPATRGVRSYAGGYSAFAEAQEHERAAHAEAWRRQQEYVARVEADIARLKGQAAGAERASTPADRDAKFFLDKRTAAKGIAQKAKARERKLERFLGSDERVDRPRRGWGLKLDFGPAPEAGKAVLRAEGLRFAYPGAAAPLLDGVDLEVGYGERVALSGPNGAGKTTLLRLVAGQLVPSGGSLRLGASVRAGFLAQEQETLEPERTVLEVALAARPMEQAAARAFLHQFLFGGDAVFRRVRECSLGERTRLQLALLVLGGCNLLLLDEPLNHLDIAGREQFEAALDAFSGTVVAVTHDRAFLASWPSRIVEVGGGRVVERAV